MSRKVWSLVFLLSFTVFFSCFAKAQETPYFVTYSHRMEEVGDLDIELKNANGRPGRDDRFSSAAVELEYGARPWWTTEFYLDGQSTEKQSTIFTGFRWENRFRILRKKHTVNPVLYAEFEDIDGADKTLLEVVGHDGASDLEVNNAAAREDKQRELELKLILSSDVKGWNIAENFISEKNLTDAPWEFGYALGASRPLSRKTGRNCKFCAEKFDLGAEMYGGLGDTDSLGTHDTSHYVAPVAGWSLPAGLTLTGSVGFGLNDDSLPRVYRAGVSYELNQIWSKDDDDDR